MEYYSKHISKLIEELARLPGIGAKSAGTACISHHQHAERTGGKPGRSDAGSPRKMSGTARPCCTLTDQEQCPICRNEERDHKTIMVVETPRDLTAYEKTGKYNGVYHVLHGAISPMLGIGPGDIRLKELMERLQGDVDEVIIATNSTPGGGNHSDVHQQTDQTNRDQSQQDRQRRSGRRRSGIY